MIPSLCCCCCSKQYFKVTYYDTEIPERFLGYFYVVDRPPFEVNSYIITYNPLRVTRVVADGSMNPESILINFIGKEDIPSHITPLPCDPYNIVVFLDGSDENVAILNRPPEVIYA